MKNALIILASAILSVAGMIVACVVASGLLLNMKRDEQQRRDAPLVDEAQEAVEKYLRDGTHGPSGHQGAVQKIDNKFTFDRAGILEKFGELQSISGSGHSPPHSWNIQGYYYLSARRTAHFSKGDVALRIVVTEGRATAPGVPELRVRPDIGSGSPDGIRIYVSHPKLVHP